MIVWTLSLTSFNQWGRCPFLRMSLYYICGYISTKQKLYPLDSYLKHLAQCLVQSSYIVIFILWWITSISAKWEIIVFIALWLQSIFRRSWGEGVDPVSNDCGRNASRGSVLSSHPTKSVFQDDQYGDDTQDRFALWILFTSGGYRPLVLVTLVQIHNS